MRACGSPGEWVSPQYVDLEPDLLEECDYLLSGFAAEFTDVVDLSLLAGVQMIGGGLTLTFNERLESLAGLEEVVELGQLVMRENDRLPHLDALARVRRVHGLLGVWRNESLESIEGLSNVTCVGSLLLRAEPGVELSQLPSLERVREDCTLTGFDRESVRTFLDRVDVGGDIVVDGMTWDG